jgi:predicted RNase H-like nuclease
VFAKRIFAYKNAIDAQKSQELEDLVAFIRKVTRMNVTINMKFDDTGLASVRVENINKNNPLMDDFRRMLPRSTGQ